MDSKTLSINHKHLTARRSRPVRQRDPYDGLRPWSAITHGIGAVGAAVGTVLLLWRSWGTPVKVLSFAIYGATMICLYLASTLYHSVNNSVPGRLALRKYDHCSIYLLIAGSYTPICLVVLKGTVGTTLLWVIWLVGAAGVILTLAKLNIPRWLTSAIYLAMGWLAIFAMVPLSQAMPWEGMFWLLSGGILYSVGGILYAVKWPGRDRPKFGCHEIFHVFIVLGSICHFLMMYRVILPF